MKLKPEDRVFLTWNEPDCTADEMNGVVLHIDTNGLVKVRFDSGDVEGQYEPSDFIVIESSP